MPCSDNWYITTDIKDIDSPALLVFPERVKANIQTAIKMTGDASRLRPHVKTHKSPDLTRLLLKAGIQKFKCATIAEAEMLAQCSAPDVLLAYQPAGPKLERFIRLIQTYPSTRFSCLVDNTGSATQQSDAFTRNGLIVPVFVDLNVGMNRTGITPGKDAIALYRFIANAAGLQPGGLHAYDGHIRDADLTIRCAQCDAAFASVEKLKQQLEADNLAVPTVIMGGSPAFSIHCHRKNIECSPGTFVYWDKSYLDGCPEQNFLPAAVLVTRVISVISPTRFTTDLGHKSVASENEIDRRIYFLGISGLQPVGQSEEHLVLETSSPHPFHPGDVLYGLPFHVCPTVSLYERALTIEQGKLSGEWKATARDRKIST